MRELLAELLDLLLRVIPGSSCSGDFKSAGFHHSSVGVEHVAGIEHRVERATQCLNGDFLLLRNASQHGHVAIARAGAQTDIDGDLHVGFPAARIELRSTRHLDLMCLTDFWFCTNNFNNLAEHLFEAAAFAMLRA